MNGEDRESLIRRILVALDASPHSLVALRAAVELAAHLDAELLGLYVEDVNLLRLAELPLAREFSYFSTSPRQVDRQQIEQQLRAQARQARRAMETQAARTGLRWSFRVARGVISVELLNAAREADLVILGRTGWSRSRRLGSTVRVILSDAPHLALVSGQNARLQLPVTIIYDGTDRAQRALAAAAHLMEGRGSYLVVVILATSLDAARRFQAETSAWLQERDLQARYRWLVGGDGRMLSGLLDEEHCGLLVMPAEGEIISAKARSELVDQMDCPVLWVR